MKRNLIVLILVISIGFLSMFFLDENTRPDSNITNIQSTTQSPLQAAPDFIWQDLNGKSHEFSDLMGKAVILNFWATWCAPCVVEFPLMVELAKRNEKDTVFLFVSVDDNTQNIFDFLKKHGDEESAKNIYFAWDQNKKISMDLFGTVKYPETYIIDNTMNITDKIIGADVDWLGTDIQEKINAAISPD